METSKYVEQRGDGWYIRGSRVSLDSVIRAFHDGLSPEAISRECFPAISLEQAYGAIAFYLANRSELDACLAAAAETFEAERANQTTGYPDLTRKLTQVRK